MLFWRPTFWMLRLTVGLAAVLPRVDVLASNGPNGASPTRDAVNLVLWGVQERPPSHAPGTATAINEDMARIDGVNHSARLAVQLQYVSIL